MTSPCSSRVTSEPTGGSGFFSESEEGCGKGASDRLESGEMGAP